MRSEAQTVRDYLDQLPEDRRQVISRVRDIILAHLPDGYEETMNWGMISYEIPLERYPDTYNGQPLGYLALAAQKNYNALYMMGVYGDTERERALKDAHESAGKKLNMGKSCLRFKKLDDLELDAIADVVRSTLPEDFIEKYEAGRRK